MSEFTGKRVLNSSASSLREWQVLNKAYFSRND